MHFKGRNEDGWKHITDHTAVNLQALRKTSGWSRQEVLTRLKEQTGVEMHETTLRRVESGTQQPKALEAAGLAAIFGVTVETLVTDLIDPEIAEFLKLQAAILENRSELDLWADMYLDVIQEATTVLHTARNSSIKQAPPVQWITNHIKDNQRLISLVRLLRNLLREDYGKPEADKEILKWCRENGEG